MKKQIIAKFNIEPEKVSQFIILAKSMVNETRKEEGCISYNLYQNCLENKPEFIFHEEYKDQASLDHHHNSAYLSNFLSEVKPILAQEPSIDVF